MNYKLRGHACASAQKSRTARFASPKPPLKKIDVQFLHTKYKLIPALIFSFISC